MRLFLVLITTSLMTLPAVGAILFKGGSEQTQSRHSYDQSGDAHLVSSFWSKRKMGLGLVAAGVYGLAGGQVGIHFHPQWSVDLGFGGGSHFQSFGFRFKKMLLMSSPLNPYIGVGFQRWQRSSDRPFDSGSISPGYIAKQFMEDDDRANNHIDEKLITGSLGLQYIFTHGDWVGYGFFAEAVFLLSAEDFDSAPTASLGFNYFF